MEFFIFLGVFGAFAAFWNSTIVIKNQSKINDKLDDIKRILDA